jgi:hypothetical protein
MPFESGAISCSMFHVPRLPEDAIERFARAAAPPLHTLGNGEIRGWVGGRHWLDVPITEENARCAGYLCLSFLRAERRAPAALVRAYCRLEELALQRAEGLPFLNSRRRAEIRRAVMERLRPEMPPQLRAIPFVHLAPRGLVLAQTSTDAQRDLFAVEFFKAVGEKPEPLTPSSLAWTRRRVATDEWGRTSFSPEIPDDDSSAGAGAQFLTWLWFATEQRGGQIRTRDEGEFALALDGPLVFYREGDGAHETLVRRGAPLLSAEAKTCLLAGKTLRSARLLLARGDEEWRTTLAADRFVLRGLRLPEERGPRRAFDPASRFEERMFALDRFLEALFTWYDAFVDERTDPERWQATRREIHDWVSSRKARR